MKYSQPGNSLNFNENNSFHDEINFLTRNFPVSVRHLNWFLTLVRHSVRIKFEPKRCVVNTFLEAWT